MHYFEAQKDWLVSSIFSIFGNKESYRFPCIQFTLKINYFLVDTVIQVEDDLTREKSFIFGSIIDALNFIDHPDILENTISLFSKRRDNNGEYVISDLTEIIQAKDDAEQTAYIFCCKNKRRYIDTILGKNETDLKEFKTIYKQN